jgi:hypothetical protein
VNGRTDRRGPRVLFPGIDCCREMWNFGSRSDSFSPLSAVWPYCHVGVNNTFVSHGKDYCGPGAFLPSSAVTLEDTF